MFIRVALNDGSLTDYLNALQWNSSVTKYFIDSDTLLTLYFRKYYEEFAFFRQEDLGSIFVTLLDTLTATVQFRLWLKIREIDKDDYWEYVKLL